MGFHFVIKTDNVAISYFHTQKKQSHKKAQWQDLLVEFDYMMEYKSRSVN